MHWMTVGIITLGLTTTLAADESPLVEKYLHSGELANGEQTLEAALAAAPNDDQIRFGLGVLQLVRGVERLGQSLHEYGAKSEGRNTPFLRLPVPINPDPAPINYTAFRRVLDDFLRDLSAAEATLSSVTSNDVKLPLRLAEIRLDLDSDGKPTDRLIDILRAIMLRQGFGFLRSNPDFLVSFDRGDVTWLQAYCHLLMGMLDFYLAFDTEPWFDLSAHELFARPRHQFEGRDRERRRKMREAMRVIAVKEPRRLGRFRKHLIKVAELNRETWWRIRAEWDNDHEWLPNPNQEGVLGLRVENNMIDAWLAMMAELESALKGDRAVLKDWLGRQERAFCRSLSRLTTHPPGSCNQGRGGLDLKTLLDDPPEKLVLDNGFPLNLPDRYFSDEQDLDMIVLFRVATIFQDTTAVAYAAWFN